MAKYIFPPRIVLVGTGNNTSARIENVSMSTQFPLSFSDEWEPNAWQSCIIDKVPGIITTIGCQVVHMNNITLFHGMKSSLEREWEDKYAGLP